jgi:hypothetical protein
MGDFRSCVRAIAQAVSRRFPIAAARVLSRVRSYGICCGPSGTGVGVLVLRFPLPILIPPAAPHSLFVLPATLYSLNTDIVIK